MQNNTQHLFAQKILFLDFNQIILNLKYATLNTVLNAYALILFYEIIFQNLTFYANNGTAYLHCKVCFLLGN